MEYSVFVAICVVGVFLAFTAVVAIFMAYGSSQPPNEEAWQFKPSVYQPMPMLTHRPAAPEAAKTPAPAEAPVAAAA